MSDWTFGKKHGVEVRPDDPFLRPKKTLKFVNNTGLKIKVSRLPSDWHSVKFLLESPATPIYNKYGPKEASPLADLDHEDIIELDFFPPGEREIDRP